MEDLLLSQKCSSCNSFHLKNIFILHYTLSIELVRECKLKTNVGDQKVSSHLITLQDSRLAKETRWHPPFLLKFPRIVCEPCGSSVTKISYILQYSTISYELKGLIPQIYAMLEIYDPNVMIVQEEMICNFWTKSSKEINVKYLL